MSPLLALAVLIAAPFALGSLVTWAILSSQRPHDSSHLRVAQLESENALLRCQLASASAALHDARECVVRANRAMARTQRRRVK